VVIYVLMPARGWTRKEEFANNFLGLNWSPQAENWNGRYVCPVPQCTASVVHSPAWIITSGQHVTSCCQHMAVPVHWMSSDLECWLIGLTHPMWHWLAKHVDSSVSLCT